MFVLLYKLIPQITLGYRGFRNGLFKRIIEINQFYTGFFADFEVLAMKKFNLKYSIFTVF